MQEPIICSKLRSMLCQAEADSNSGPKLSRLCTARSVPLSRAAKCNVLLPESSLHYTNLKLDS